MSGGCWIVAPRQEKIVGRRRDGYLAECILPYLHEGAHVIQTPEGRYFSWEYEEDCDCCEPGEHERCYAHEKIEECQVLALLKKVSSA